jgi:hypothetical protein
MEWSHANINTHIPAYSFKNLIIVVAFSYN